MSEQEQAAQLVEVENTDSANTPTQDAPESPVNDFMNNPDVMAYIDLKVQEGIKKALKGNTPKASTVNPTEQERKNFEKMTYRERLNLFNSDPHTYNKLSRGDV